MWFILFFILFIPKIAMADRIQILDEDNIVITNDQGNSATFTRTQIQKQTGRACKEAIALNQRLVLKQQQCLDAQANEAKINTAVTLFQAKQNTPVLSVQESK